ncbi:hypothetical protein P171DRAFT_430215 [Karstenula rhodostoma CBS 690.94]|uniref:HCP-like protein n=1 Tax=Karstenula rhodostoma CBS 690.94 TaxID=1392251 RepID=A0A9P4PN90_9PLEO|nr:hypothetical protein P171DRAFT_430215 [Karstenula rhodostoma CBS 690.94]
MAYPQQPRQQYDEYQQPPRQQQYYNQGAPQQARRPVGYATQYDQQYDDYGYDQGQYEQWDDGSYNQGSGWDHDQQRGYGHVNQQPRQRGPPQDGHVNQQPRQRGPSQDGYDQQYRQPPPQQRDPRAPMGRGGGPTPPMQGRGGMRPPPAGTERPRMAPASPTSVPQDNPFPSFPSQKVKPRPKAGSMDEAMALMTLGPENAGQGRGMGPPPGRGRGPPPMQQRGPPMGRGGQPDMQRHDSGHYEGSGRGQRPPPNRMPPNRGPPPPQQRFGPVQRSMTMPQNMPGPGNQRRYENPQKQWVESGAAAGYHGPESPTYIPPRPTTAGGTKSNSYGSQQGFDQRPPMPHAHQQQQQPQFHPNDSSRYHHEASLDTVYDDYYGEDRQSKVSIDMPDFDAIQQPNNGHRRGDSLDNHLSPTTGPPADSMIRIAGAGYTQANNFYQQAAKTRSQPDLHGQYNVHEMAADAPPMPGMHSEHVPYQPPNGLPSGPRGRGPSLRGMTSDRATPGAGYGPGQPSNFDPRYGRPPLGPERVYSDETTYSEPAPNSMRNASPMAPGKPIQRPGTAAPAPGRVPSDPPGRHRPGPTQPTNPDALPAHPAPFRPGLMQQQNPVIPSAQATKPPPIRQYNSEPAPSEYSNQPGGPAQIQRVGSVKHPVTHDELNRLKKTWGGNLQDPKTGLELAKKLVEAASVLADEGGTADNRTKNKNRERFINEAYKVVKKLCAAGSPDAMFYLADCYGQGQLGLQVDTKEAFTLYQSAAKAGHPAAAYRTAVCCEMGHEEGGGTKKDPLKAVQWYRRAATLGDPPAMYKMGMILLKGLLGQQKHLGEAVNMLKRAADHADADNPHALHELGLLYEAQTGNERIMRDEPYALSLFKQAAELGYKFSQFRLGQAFEYGLLGCPVDARLSIGWYTRAAAQEEHQSELALSGWYLTGVEGILGQSDTEAYLWARKAACAEPPLPKALFAMGYFTEVGIGCPRSLDEAKRWYGRAAAYKFPKAQERLEELKKGGSKVQMKRERLSRTNQRQQEENCVVM